MLRGGEFEASETLREKLLRCGSEIPATNSFLGGPSDSTPPFLFRGANGGHRTALTVGLNLRVGLGEELGVTPESWEGLHEFE